MNSLPDWGLARRVATLVAPFFEEPPVALPEEDLFGSAFILVPTIEGDCFVTPPSSPLPTDESLKFSDVANLPFKTAKGTVGFLTCNNLLALGDLLKCQKTADLERETQLLARLEWKPSEKEARLRNCSSIASQEEVTLPQSQIKVFVPRAFLADLYRTGDGQRYFINGVPVQRREEEPQSINSSIDPNDPFLARIIESLFHALGSDSNQLLMITGLAQQNAAIDIAGQLSRFYQEIKPDETLFFGGTHRTSCEIYTDPPQVVVLCSGTIQGQAKDMNSMRSFNPPISFSIEAPYEFSPQTITYKLRKPSPEK